MSFYKWGNICLRCCHKPAQEITQDSAAEEEEAVWRMELDCARGCQTCLSVCLPTGLIWFNIPWTGSAFSAGGATRTSLNNPGSSIWSCCGSWLKAAKPSRNLSLRGGCCYKTCSGTETLFEELRSCLVKVPPPLGPVWLTTHHVGSRQRMRRAYYSNRVKRLTSAELEAAFRRF